MIAAPSVVPGAVPGAVPGVVPGVNMGQISVRSKSLVSRRVFFLIDKSASRIL